MNSICYDKLVRDKIPDVIRKAGKQPITDVMSQDDMTAALNRKLLEEALFDYLKAHPESDYQLPQDVIDKTIAKYEEAYALLTGV